MATCAHCGHTDGEPGGDDLPAGWSLATSERDPARLDRLCLGCTRTNIRAIEGKLPEEWWS